MVTVCRNNADRRFNSYILFPVPMNAEGSPSSSPKAKHEPKTPRLEHLRQTAANR